MESSRSEFEEFAIASTPSLLRSAYLLTGDQQLAEDLVQSALARTHRYWNRINKSGNFAAYTRKTMYHLQVTWWRRRRVTEHLGVSVADAPTPDQVSNVDLKLSLRKALFELPVKQRAAVVLRFFEDRSVAETAEILGCSEGTVKTQTFRALRRLREILPDLADVITGGR